MAFTLPSFLNSYDWWVPGNPTTNSPDVTGNCQLYVNNRQYLMDANAAVSGFVPTVLIRVDRSWWANIGIPTNSSIWRIDDFYGNRWYYGQLWWDYIHRGFPNEYIEVVAVQITSIGIYPDTNR